MAMIPAMMTGMMSVGCAVSACFQRGRSSRRRRSSPARCPPRVSIQGQRTLDNEIRPEYTHGGDAHTSFGGTVGGTKAGEDDG